jgi:hypothetical protein
MEIQAVVFPSTVSAFLRILRLIFRAGKKRISPQLGIHDEMGIYSHRAMGQRKRALHNNKEKNKKAN